MGLVFGDTIVITPALRDGAPTIGAMTTMIMTGAGQYFTEVIDVGTFSEIVAFLNVTSNSGSSPTLDIAVQYSADKKKFADSGDTFTQVTTTNALTFKKLSGFGKYIRFRIVLGGTTPSYVVDFKLSCKSGTGGAIQSYDSNGNALVSLGTAIAGENLTTNRLNVEPIYSYARMTSAATLLVKTGAGTLHSITINTPVASGTIEVDDALTNTTPIIGKITLPGTLLSDGPKTAIYDVSFTTGLSITTTGTMDITIAYR